MTSTAERVAAAPTALAAAITEARGDRPRRTFAAEIECTEAAVYRWEKGRGRPVLLRDLRHLHRAGVSIELLLAEDDDDATASA